MLCFSSATSGGSLGRAAPGRPGCPPSPHVPRSLGAPARPRPSPSSWSDFLARKPARQPLAEQQRESLGGTLGACHTHRPRTALCLPPAGRLPPPPCSHPGLPRKRSLCFSSPCLLPPTPSSSVCPSACSHRASSHDRAASLCDITPAPCGSSKAVPRAWARGHPLLGPSHALRDPPGRRYFLWPVPSPRARSRLGPVPRSAGRRQGEQGVSQSSRC